MKNLPSINNINNYISYVNSIPNLTEQEEEDLCNKKENGDLLSAQKLILAHLKQVIYIAKLYTNYGFSKEELIQEGNIGLMRAVKNFKNGFGARLKTYCQLWIHAEIKEYILENINIVKLSASKKIKKLFFNYRKRKKELIEVLGYNETSAEKEIMKEMEVSQEDINIIKGTFLGHKEIDPELSIYESPEIKLLSQENEIIKQKILEKIESLSESEKLILKTKYLEDKKTTNKEIAKKMGISSERVRQIENKAIQKIRKSIN